MLLNNIVLHDFLTILPVISIGAMFYLLYKEAQKRRQAEKLLKQTREVLRDKEKTLEEAANTDYLTKLQNRRGLLKYSRNHAGLSTAYIIGDIDGYKKVNDTFGHHAGDQVLVEVAKILRQNAPEDAAVCRWGGEEFVIVLPGYTQEEAVRLSERFRAEIAALAVPVDGGADIHVTMTFGVCWSEEGISLEESITGADAALYRGKTQGGNRVVSCFDGILAKPVGCLIE